MAKHLLLIRHAKSDWGDLNLRDFKRPLNSRGHQNAPEMAKRLVNKNLIPQQIVSSPALRAITTAEYFAKEFGINSSDIIQEPEIYDALPFTLLEIINELDDQSEFIALIGHNPGLTCLVNLFCDTSIHNIPTCGMALIRFPFDSWKMLSSGTGELIFFDYPKNTES
ncbi:histidine phosphatase family protein [Daejeonella sp. H1SJ63]|jgi:phosphohistidine phosphatase|uniref:SixA phosphatase family protein n=1 Tax=Daejeonella sp. H1SJ63 TaxID=3034145 RepID=UPI0023ECE9DC|nr:histidine phosphatase family protein [Daejeonella sp. H1SJ63]